MPKFGCSPGESSCQPRGVTAPAHPPRFACRAHTGCLPPANMGLPEWGGDRAMGLALGDAAAGGTQACPRMHTHTAARVSLAPNSARGILAIHLSPAELGRAIRMEKRADKTVLGPLLRYGAGG